MPESSKLVPPLRISSIHDPRYKRVIEVVIQARKHMKMSQSELAAKTGFTQPEISKVERCERRIDIIELLDIIHAISAENKKLKNEIWKQVNEYYIES